MATRGTEPSCTFQLYYMFSASQEARLFRVVGESLCFGSLAAGCSPVYKVLKRKPRIYGMEDIVTGLQVRSHACKNLQLSVNAIQEKLVQHG